MSDRLHIVLTITDEGIEITAAKGLAANEARTLGHLAPGQELTVHDQGLIWAHVEAVDQAGDIDAIEDHANNG